MTPNMFDDIPVPFTSYDLQNSVQEQCCEVPQRSSAKTVL